MSDRGAGATAAADAAIFEGAVIEFAAAPNNPKPIRSMMGLLESSNPLIRQWAGKWLWEKCRVRVANEGEDLSRAATPKAANLP